MKRNSCPTCGKLFVEPYGFAKATILVVGEYPGYNDTKEGIPFSGDSGNVIKTEFAKAGINVNECRFMNMWQHVPDDNCPLDAHMKTLLQEAKGKKYILFMGTMVSQEIFHKAVNDVAGIELTSPLFPKARLMVAPHPATILKGTIGELRLAIQKFKEILE